MNVYEFISPSDPITFWASNDKVALVCSIVLGKGKAGCHRYGKDGEEININSLLICDPTPIKTIEKELGMGLHLFWEKHKRKIKKCFASFAYTDVEDRKTFDDALAAIGDEKKRKEFKAKHEDRNRTSLNQWVQAAWDIADNIK